MSKDFFNSPTLNSPYEYPSRHWELDEEGQPTNNVIETRRSVSLITPIPKPRKSTQDQSKLVFDDKARELDTGGQQYDQTFVINNLRSCVDEWRTLPQEKWGVTPETARLLLHWRNHKSKMNRPMFFCQVEAVETVIWLTEVSRSKGSGKQFIDHLRMVNEISNPDLDRLALKMATGSGKTAVMAMIIAWQTINAVRHPSSRLFTQGFLVVTPGLTIRDRLRVLHPNDPDSYYKHSGLVPSDMLEDLNRAKIVIVNYHAFKKRENIDLSKGGRAFLQGRRDKLNTLETDGQMIKRVMWKLMGLKNIMAINDEAHHCYHQKSIEDDVGELKGEERKDAEKNRETAKLWISGLKSVKKLIGLNRVVDLSATPFFLSGSGYVEGTLFPWTMCDFSLMDAIECGIVKVPRVPVADNIPNAEMPKFRTLWNHIGKKMPKKGRGKNAVLDPLNLPNELLTALDALYGHYEKTFNIWKKAGIEVPPCFIVVCNNTATSKLVYDYISGYYRQDQEGIKRPVQGHLELFRNFDENYNPLARPRTLLIDSQQLESGDALDKNYRTMAADEIARFRREIIERTRDRQQAENLTDQDLLREAMNTVGKPGRLGSETRCVVSVSMLTEGWDTNTVTHVLGVRAFSTQLLCEQVVGRALRRLSYDLNDNGLFEAEYADIFGIPFDFTAQPVIVKPTKPRVVVQVQAISPERDACTIKFPRVTGYRIDLPDDHVEAEFTDDSTLVLTPEITGPAITRNEGIFGEGVDIDLKHLEKVRSATVLFYLTKYLIEEKFRDHGGEPKLHLFGELKSIARKWIKSHLICKGDTKKAQILYKDIGDMACERISSAITLKHSKEKPVLAVLDSYNSSGSTSDVSFTTVKERLWKTSPHHCHVNYAVCDSSWEQEFCRVVDNHPRVLSYVKNQGLGLEIPYRNGMVARNYIPDFIVLVDDDTDDPLHLIVEIKGYRREDAKEKKSAAEVYWVQGVNNLGNWGRWAFAEFCDVNTIKSDFDKFISSAII